jgi:hypothetical protein
VAKHRVGPDHIAVSFILNNRAAFPVGAIRRRSIAISDKHVAIQYSDRIGGEVNTCTSRPVRLNGTDLAGSI